MQVIVSCNRHTFAVFQLLNNICPSNTFQMHSFQLYRLQEKIYLFSVDLFVVWKKYYIFARSAFDALKNLEDFEDFGNYKRVSTGKPQSRL